MSDAVRRTLASPARLGSVRFGSVVAAVTVTQSTSCELVLRKMKQVRSLSRKTIPHRQEATLAGFHPSVCLFICLCGGLKPSASSPLVSPFLVFSFLVIHSSHPAAICVGYHVVILFRHLAYDGPWACHSGCNFPYKGGY